MLTPFDPFNDSLAEVQATIADIYQALAESDTVTLPCATLEDAKNIKMRINATKYRMEKPLVAMGVMPPRSLEMRYDEVNSIASFKIVAETTRQAETFKIIRTPAAN